VSDTPRLFLSVAIEFARSDNTTGGLMTRRALLTLADEVERLEREVAALRQKLASVEQVSGELCEKCGWAMKFPTDLCRCELERENAALRIEIKDAGMKGLSVALEAYTRDLQDVKAEITALQQDKEKLLKIIADLESLSHHAMCEANRGGAGYDINEELKEARTAIDTIRKSKDDTR